MPIPYIHLDRRMNHGGALHAYADDLPDLAAAGIRSVVSLLNIPSDESVYTTAGFSFLCLPIMNGGAPTIDQAIRFNRFVDEQRAKARPVAVHCEAGLGRTGTMLAAYLIAKGQSASEAIGNVRRVEKSAIETSGQLQFLHDFQRHLPPAKPDGAA